MKELNEMTIGRTDDPENPLRAMAFEVTSLLGTGSPTPSGPAVMAPHQQAGHMIAIDLPVKLTFLLHPRGRPHMARRTCRLRLPPPPARPPSREPSTSPAVQHAPVSLHLPMPPPSGATGGDSSRCKPRRFRPSVLHAADRSLTALQHPQEHNEAANAIRALIDRITLTPGPKCGEIAATLHSDLGTILEWVSQKQNTPGQIGGNRPVITALLCPGSSCWHCRP